jgi:pimeloyl-ACP methyl ester carboxylesterase
VASRIPSTTGGGPQVRIEKYASPAGETRWSVYVGGTVELIPARTDEAFDIESAVASVAGEDGAAYRAVLDAMADAGVGTEDAVAITGHSQGGLVAAAVAASGEYAVDTVVTFGAPSAQVPVLDGVTTVAVEHSDDLVPALAGTEPVDDERTIVSRDTLSRAQEGDSLLSAHSIEEYTRTAELMDASDDRRMIELREALARIAPEGGPGSSTLYRADRVLR